MVDFRQKPVDIICILVSCFVWTTLEHLSLTTTKGLFCPFAHRANLVRYLKGLEDTITISVVKPYPKGDAKGWPGWQFAKDNEYPDATIDHLFDSQYLHEVYFKADPEYKGRYSVPLLWDKKSKTIVNNDSAEMLRWLPMAFNSLIKDPKIKALDLYPEQLRSSIDKISIWIQRDLNSGVYKAGFGKYNDSEGFVLPIYVHNAKPFQYGDCQNTH